MCEQVTKEILFSQGAHETQIQDCDDNGDPLPASYFWLDREKRNVLEYGTGNSLYVELRCYDGLEYILETLIRIDGVIEFRDAEVMENCSRHQAIRKAIQIFDQHFENHPARVNAN